MKSFTIPSVLYSRKLFVLFFLIAMWFSGISGVVAQDISDFKEAADNTGCESIPYSSERSACQSLQDEIDDNCKDEPVPCVSLLGQKERLIEKVGNAGEQLERSKDKKDDIQDKIDDTEVEGEIAKYKEELFVAEEDIKESQKLWDELEKEYDDFDDEHSIEELYKRAQRCFEARKKSNELFDDVMEKLYRDGSTLTTEEEREFEAYSVKITDHIKSEVAGHIKQMEEVESRMENCRKVLDLK